MFIGRKSELEGLERLYQSGKFEFVVMHGRKGVGKSSIIFKFMEEKPVVYFNAAEVNQKLNLEGLSKAIWSGLNESGEEKNAFPSFEKALEEVFKRSRKERLVFVADEYQYLAGCDQSLNSVLKKLIDQYQKDSKLMLILCGSSISYRLNEVMAYRAPLYGRMTAQIKVKPFEFHEASQFFLREAGRRRRGCMEFPEGLPRTWIRLIPHRMLSP